MLKEEGKQKEIEEIRGKLKKMFDLAWNMKTEPGTDADKLRRMVCSFTPEIEQSYVAFSETAMEHQTVVSENREDEEPEITEHFNVGEKVVIRDWEDMAKDAQILSVDGDKFIDLPETVFNELMKQFCGKEATVIKKNGHECTLDFHDDTLNIASTRWIFTDYMLNASKNPIGVETQVPEITDKFCVGEKVIVRSWDDMAKDAAILSTEHVNHPYVKFDKSMNYHV